MSTFAELIVKPNVGLAYGLDVSLDDFATVTYRYGTHAGRLDGTNDYAPRIASLSNLSRSLTPDHGFSAASISLTLDNTDAALDWLLDTTATANIIKARYRLRVWAFDPALPSDGATMVLGLFASMNWPTRDAAKLTLQLADNTITTAAELAQLPTIRDWMAVDSGIAALESMTLAQIIGQGVESVPGIDVDAPLPLLFGSDAVPLTHVYGNIYAACAVAGAPSGASDIEALYFTQATGGSVSVPATTPKARTGDDGVDTLWTTGRSSSLTVDGKTFHVLWVALKLNANTSWTPSAMDEYLRDFAVAEFRATTNGASQSGINMDRHRAVAPVTVRGHGLSQTYSPPAALFDEAHPADVAYDLLANYSAGSLTVTAAGFTSAKAARPRAIAVGAVQQSESVSLVGTTAFREVTGGALLAAVRGLCSVGGFDVYFSWAGAACCAPPLVADFTVLTATPAAIDEVLMKDVVERIPSAGERWAPYNRVFLRVGGEMFGPVDDVAMLAAWGRPISHVIDGAWSGVRGTGLEHAIPYVEGRVVRPVIQWTYPPAGLLRELGDYITVSWTRGGRGTPYASVLFRVEGLEVNLSNGLTQLQAVWVADLTDTTQRQYLLDDEANILVATGSGARTATVTTGSSTIAFSSGSLITDGVAAGDVLIIQDATEDTVGFLRNRAVRVDSVTDATHLVYTGSTSWGAAGPYAVETWWLRNGALTYPSSGANYPSGSTMYGKAVDVSGDAYYSDLATRANQLRSG